MQPGVFSNDLPLQDDTSSQTTLGHGLQHSVIEKIDRMVTNIIPCIFIFISKITTRENLGIMFSK